MYFVALMVPRCFLAATISVRKYDMHKEPQKIVH